MIIDQLKENRANEYTALLHKLIQNYESFPLEGRKKFIQDWNLQAVKKKINSHLLLFCDINDRMNGLLLGTYPEGGVSTILWLLVEEEFRAKGMGKLLIDSSIQFYKRKNSHKIKLSICEKYLLKFYEKLGFRLEGRHSRHWWETTFYSLGKEL